MLTVYSKLEFVLVKTDYRCRYLNVTNSECHSSKNSRINFKTKDNIVDGQPWMWQTALCCIPGVLEFNSSPTDTHCFVVWNLIHSQCAEKNGWTTINALISVAHTVHILAVWLQLHTIFIVSKICIYCVLQPVKSRNKHTKWNTICFTLIIWEFTERITVEQLYRYILKSVTE